MISSAFPSSRLGTHIFCRSSCFGKLEGAYLIRLNYLRFTPRRKDLHFPGNPFRQAVRSHFQVIIGLEPSQNSAEVPK
jgi:hypothetical protein